MSRLSTLSSNPTLRNFAKDASQNAIRKVARFLAPLVECPDVTGKYKIYNSEHRYKRPETRRALGDRATRIGFTATDANFNLVPHALDFAIPKIAGMSEETLMNYAQYGTQLLADASALDHEAEVIAAALAAAGSGTDSNFASSGVDPIALLDAAIMTTYKAAKNGAGVKVLFGADALVNLKNNANVRGRFVTGAKNGIIAPSLKDIQGLLVTNPECEVSMYVQDTAAEGVSESISFLLSTGILIFASNSAPNTMDPSFMKTFVPMGGFMVPGSYTTEDQRDEVLKMDWTAEVAVTNSAAVTRINGNAS